MRIKLPPPPPFPAPPPPSPAQVLGSNRGIWGPSSPIKQRLGVNPDGLRLPEGLGPPQRLGSWAPRAPEGSSPPPGVVWGKKGFFWGQAAAVAVATLPGGGRDVALLPARGRFRRDVGSLPALRSATATGAGERAAAAARNPLSLIGGRLCVCPPPPSPQGWPRWPPAARWSPSTWCGCPRTPARGTTSWPSTPPTRSTSPPGTRRAWSGT